MLPLPQIKIFHLILKNSILISVNTSTEWTYDLGIKDFSHLFALPVVTGLHRHNRTTGEPVANVSTHEP